jgi:hypothetical protein
MSDQPNHFPQRFIDSDYEASRALSRKPYNMDCTSGGGTRQRIADSIRLHRSE